MYGGGGRGRPPAAHHQTPQRKRLIDYPRDGRRGWTRWVPSWKLVGGLVGLGTVTLVAMFAAAYAATQIPVPDELTKAQTSVVFFDDGKTELGRFEVQNRRSVKLATVPLTTRRAVLAAEDRTFYSNSGVSPTAIVRAAWNNFRGGSLQGGSTITQQYVKNSYDLRDRTLKRKAREFFIAIKLNRGNRKDVILENYLNTIYFGRKAYGIEAASQAYFGKSVGKLTVSESAYLAGIINGPELYDPRDGDAQKAKATQRWNYVLDGMQAEGWITPAERAKQVFPKTIKPVQENSRGGYRGYLLQMVREEAKSKAGYTDEQIDTMGLKITTTFDKRLMDASMRAVRQTLPKKRPKGLQVAMATIDPQTGAVKAIYGGPDFLERQRNAATQDIAQQGSTAKPFALIAALKDGMSLRSRYDGRSPQEIKGFKVRNFGNSQYGFIDLPTATANSVNTVYVQLNNDIGAEKTVDAMVKAGIPEDAVGLEGNLANVLGTASVHPIDMASAYATIANQGRRNDRFSISSITRPDKTKPYKHVDASKRVFDADVMADATYAMQQVVLRGSGAPARALGRPVAGKTGTSSDNKSAWFVGFTPQMSTSVAMYRSGKGGKVLPLVGFGQFSEITGGSYPVRIWTTFMSDALRNRKVEQFPAPVFAGEVKNPAPPPQPTQPDPGPTGDPNPRPSATDPNPRPTFPRPSRSPRPSPPTPPPGGGGGGGPG